MKRKNFAEVLRTICVEDFSFKLKLIHRIKWLLTRLGALPSCAEGRIPLCEVKNLGEIAILNTKGAVV